MAIKRVLIAYLKSNDIKSIVSREYMYNKIIQDLVAEGRAIKNSIPQTMTTFDDGSRVYLHPIALSLKGMRVTHAFVDESVLRLQNYGEIIYEAIMPILIQKSFVHELAQQYELSEPIKDRLLLFSYNNGELKTKIYKGE